MAPARVAAAILPCPAGDVACLIEAIHTANGNGEDNTIVLVAGTYTLTTVDHDTDGPNGLPSITSPLTIEGAGMETTVIERGAFATPFRLLYVTAAGTLTLNGLTITGGVQTEHAGGALFNRGTVTLANSAITGNQSISEGNGLYNASGTMIISHSTIAHNSAWLGENSFGGGLNNAGGTVDISHSTIAHNDAGSGPGGGIYNFFNGSVVISHSTIANNGADGPAGLANAGGTMLISNTTIAGNVARRFSGGGLSNFNGGTVTLTNSTVADNLAEEFGGGGLANHGGTVALQNTLLALNSITGSESQGPDCFGPMTSRGHNLIGDPMDCDIVLQATDLRGDPKLSQYTDDGTPGHGHIPLRATSPAIDAGGDEHLPRDRPTRPTAGRDL